MDFPHEFSAQARARIEAERLKASRELADAQAQKPPDAWKSGAREWDRQEFHDYILLVFLAFAREACELGKVVIWTVDRVRSEVDEFLRRFTIEAYYEKGRDRFGEKFPEMTSNWRGSLLLGVEQMFHRSDEWRQFEAELLAVAEKVAAGPDQAGETPSDQGVRTSSHDVVESQPTQQGRIRQAVILPILERKGWSRSKWASEAGVGKNSIYEYLEGRRSLSTKNRRAMAEVLDLLPEQLPE